MNRAFVFVSAIGLVAAFAALACDGLTLDDRPCPCASGWTCCATQNTCVPEGASCGSAGATDSGATDAGATDGNAPDVKPPITLPATPITLAEVPLAYSLACSPDTIYAGTTDGRLLAVPVSAPTPTEITPAPAGVVGALAWTDGHLFYTLPANGEVHARDLAGGADLVLTAHQPRPTGVAVSDAGVFFATETTVSAVAPNIADQVASPRVVFADAGSTSPVGPARGLALFGPRYIVIHKTTFDGGFDDSVATYSSTGVQLIDLPLFTPAISVATSAARTYWSDGNSTVEFARKDIASASGELFTNQAVTDQVLLGGICVQGGRLYFTAANNNDVREIRYVDVE